MNVPFALGSALVLSSSVAVGLSVVADRKRSLRHTEAMLNLIGHIRANIDYFLTPVSAIFTDFKNRDLDSCGFTDVLRKDGLAAAARSKTASISNETEELLVALSSSLGDGYREEQIRLCDYYRDRIAVALKEQREEFDRELNIFRFVPGLLALFIILCFI